MHLSIAIGCCSWIFLLTFSRFCFQGSFFNNAPTLKLCLNSVQVCVRLISLSMNRRDRYLLQFNSTDIRITPFNIVVVLLLNLKRHVSIGMKLNSVGFLYFSRSLHFHCFIFSICRIFYESWSRISRSTYKCFPNRNFLV